ncbi:BTAD domain-containing putative transcriptional regulator [Micromonospora sp. NPDC048935]|uniref:AfsR/SARP family transcriptional regulator n=1 Tax=Micromonospora sp. NPDC048935 TaxID=3364262 RepID=UPI00371E7755
MSELYIAVLGPLRIQVGQATVRIGPRLAALLSVLLLEAGKPVAAQRLIDLLWDSSPSDSAPVTLRSHVSHLRRALTPQRPPSGGGVLVTVGSGRGLAYRLDVTAEQVDVHRFEEAYAQGRRLLVDGGREQVERAAGLIGAALALWRGPAYPEVADRSFALPEVARLEALRRSARNGHAEALIALGRYTEAAGDLTRLVEEEPYDEGARRLLASVLHDLRRTDEAVRVCRTGLTLLRGRGLDAPTLQQLLRSILHGEALRTANGRPATDAGPARAARVVCLLPPDPPRFAARAAELAHAEQAIRAGDSPATIVVTGPAGVGKTTFAVRLGHALADRFPAGNLYVDLRGFDPNGPVMTTAEALRRFLDALGVPVHRLPATTEARAGLYRRLLADRRMLVVLDNARNADHVRPLLPGAAGCAVVVTSRDQLASLVTVDCARPIALGMLSAAGSRELIRRRLGTAALDAEPEATDEIVASCGGLPLALAIVAGRVAANPDVALSTLARRLRAARGGLTEFASTDAAADARSVFSWSYRTLDTGPARLFRLLGLHPGAGVTTRAAASLAGLPPEVATEHLAVLVQAHLVTVPVQGRYLVHDLLRGYAAELVAADLATHRRAALRRVLDHYLHSAVAADRLLVPAQDPIAPPPGPPAPGVTAEPLGDNQQALAWLTAEHATLVHASDWAGRAGFHTHAWQLARAVSTYLEDQGHWSDWATTQQFALAAARRSAEPAAEAGVHYHLARACQRLGRHDDAHDHYRAALTGFAAVGNRVHEAHTHRSLGGLFQREGRAEEALGHVRRALDLYRDGGHQAGQGMALNNIGWLLAQRGEFPSALTYCRQALAALREVGERHAEAATWDSLGYIQHRLGRHRGSITCYQRALALYEDLGDRYGMAETGRDLGDVQAGVGDRAAAIRSWSQAWRILDELGHPEADELRARLDVAPVS